MIFRFSRKKTSIEDFFRIRCKSKSLTLIEKMIGASRKAGTLKTPEEFEKESKSITKQMVEEKLTFITNPKEALDWLQPVLEMGFEKIILHNINYNQSDFIHDFGREVLPRLNPH